MLFYKEAGNKVIIGPLTAAYHILIRKHRILLISWMRIHMEDKYRIYLGIVARLY